MYFPEALKKIQRKMKPGLVRVVLRKRADEDSDGTPGEVGHCFCEAGFHPA